MFRVFDKANKKRLINLLLIGIVVILFAIIISSVSAATYTISTSNSTSSIDAFLNNVDYEDCSPLSNGDTVIFNAGKYNLDLNVNKAITLKTSGRVMVKSISISKNTKVTGFIVNGGFYAEGKSNTITKNTIKGYFQVYGNNNIINTNSIKETHVYGVNNTIKSNNISGDFDVFGGKNKVISNIFKKNVYIFNNRNKVTGNKVANNYKIFNRGKKNILKNNKLSYMDLALINVGKNSKGHVISVKNVGTKSSIPCYIKIDNYDMNIYNIKVPALKKGKSTKIIIPKRIINKFKYKYYETPYYGGYIYLDYKNKNKDIDLSNNQLTIWSDKKGYKVSSTM